MPESGRPDVLRFDDEEESGCLGERDPFEDWIWEGLPVSCEYLLYLRDSEIDAQSTIIPTVPSP